MNQYNDFTDEPSDNPQEKSNVHEYRINLLDTPGIDHFHSLQKQQVKRADGIVLMFDLTDRVSFEHL